LSEQEFSAGSSRERELKYALFGMLLGVMAPIGWIMLRLLLFWHSGQGLVAQIVDDILRTPEQVALYAYMCGGTAAVLGAFGFFIGRATQQIHDRAHKLDLLNREVAEQKALSERRFADLDHSIKNFHIINTDLQKTVNRKEVLRLAADGLHEVIGFDRVNILMVDDDRTQMSFAVSRGARQSDRDVKATLPLDARAGCLYKVIVDRRALLVDDITKMPDEYHLKPPCDSIEHLRSRNFIIAPILVRGEAIGLLAIDYKYQRRRLEETDVDTVKLFVDQISSSLTRINLLEAVEALTRQLEHTFSEFLKYRNEHAGLIQSLHTATGSTRDATGNITAGAGVIQESVASTRSAVGEISVSIEQVSHSLKSLNEFMERSISSMTEIHYTVEAVEESSLRSRSMSETVKQKAEHGVDTMAQVIGGMEGIVAAVGQAEGVIGRLSERGEEVGTITSVITELTRKTSLLALNAAIIAAQAGEHGRSFAVVADEVRSLAHEAANSTEQINQIIGEIQAYTRETVEHIGQTRQLVDTGRHQGLAMAEALREILDSSIQAMSMAQEISKATQEISRAVESVSKSIEELGEMSSQVSQASREEANGAKSIVTAIEEVKSMADDMVAATRRQADNTQNIEVAVDQVGVMAKRIFDEMESRRQASLSVVEDLKRLKGE